MNNDVFVADLTVEELKAIIRKTVQEAIIEIISEFSLAAEHDAELVHQAELAQLLRTLLPQNHVVTYSTDD